MGYLGKQPSAVPLTSDDITDNIITSAKIVDGAITGDDINSTFNIGSKTVTLPASSVTTHVTQFDDSAIRADISALALREATNEASAAFNLPNSFIDTFATDVIGTKTDVAVSSGYVYSAAFGSAAYNTSDRTSTFNHSAGTLTTAVSWYNGAGQQDKLFNGDNSTGNTSNSTYINEGSTYTLSNVNLLTIDFGTNPVVIDGYKMFGNNSNQSGASNPSGKVQGSQNNTDWTDLATITNNMFVCSGNTNQETTWTNNTAYRYYRFLGTSGVMSNTGWWYEIQLREKSLTLNATGTAIQAANTVGSAKTEVSGTMIYKDNAGTATLGTDLKIYFTCNGGSNWTEAASYNAITPVYATGIKQVRLGKTTCTSGTDVRYKAVWANQASGSKETQLHGIGINY